MVAWITLRPLPNCDYIVGKVAANAGKSRRSLGVSSHTHLAHRAREGMRASMALEEYMATSLVSAAYTSTWAEVR